MDFAAEKKSPKKQKLKRNSSETLIKLQSNCNGFLVVFRKNAALKQNRSQPRVWLHSFVRFEGRFGPAFLRTVFVSENLAKGKNQFNRRNFGLQFG